ncbi:hypothetical protein D3C80_1510730 [compost metagenome]
MNAVEPSPLTVVFCPFGSKVPSGLSAGGPVGFSGGVPSGLPEGVPCVPSGISGGVPSGISGRSPVGGLPPPIIPKEFPVYCCCTPLMYRLYSVLSLRSADENVTLWKFFSAV